jgi:LmbE family N-acetylglucosaminyl deacetylase
MSAPFDLRHAARFRAELMQAARVLCVQPHYDDNDIAAGGTFAQLSDAGVEVHYLTVTDNLAGVRDAELPDDAASAELRAEQARAGREIGVHAGHWLGLPDAGAWSEVDLRTSVLRHIRTLRPDYVFTCDPWLPREAHRDHLRTGIAVAEAVMFHRMPRFRTSPEPDAAYFGDATAHAVRALVLYYTLEPNLVFDVAATRARKHRAMDCYALQLAGEALAGLHRGIEAAERRFASGQAFEHAEAFQLLRPGQLHVGLVARR